MQKNIIKVPVNVASNSIKIGLGVPSQSNQLNLLRMLKQSLQKTYMKSPNQVLLDQIDNLRSQIDSLTKK